MEDTQESYMLWTPPTGADTGAGADGQGKHHGDIATNASGVVEGVSVGFLRQVRDDLGRHPFGMPVEEVTTKDCVEEFVKPHSTNGAYYTSLPHPPPAAVDRATVFVSHAWRYRVMDTLDLLIAHGDRDRAENGTETYFWYDIFMVDQNVSQNRDKEFWTTHFRDAIISIGHTLLVLSPWDNPTPLTRAWCLFEIYSTINDQVQFSILLPERERLALKTAILDNSDAVTDVMITVDGERAEAFDPADQEMIFDAVRSMDGSFHELNTRVKSLMRTWVLRVLQELVQEDLATSTVKQGGKAELLKFAKLCTNVGSVLADNGDLDQALEHHQKALSVKELLLGPDHAATALSHSYIGMAYDGKGDYHKALRSLKKALAIDEKALGTEHPSIATRYGNLGMVLNNMGDFEKALSFHLKALRIDENMLGLKHPATATSYNDVGAVYASKREYDTALKYHRRALEIEEAELGTEHPSTATSYGHIGTVLEAMGDLDEALRFHEMAGAIRESVLGTNHPSTAISYNHIAVVSQAKGDIDRALQHTLAALAIQKNLEGADAKLAVSYHRLSHIYKLRGDHDHALQYHLDAVAKEMAATAIGKRRGGSLRSTGLLAGEGGAGHAEQAQALDRTLKYLLKTVTAEEETLGIKHPFTASGYSHIGLVYSAKGNLKLGLKYHKDALAIRVEVLGKHRDTAASHMLVGEAYEGMAQDEEALRHYLQGVTIYSGLMGVAHYETLETHRRISVVYARRGNKTRARHHAELCARTTLQRAVSLCADGHGKHGGRRRHNQRQIEE